MKNKYWDVPPKRAPDGRFGGCGISPNGEYPFGTKEKLRCPLACAGGSGLRVTDGLGVVIEKGEEGITQEGAASKQSGDEGILLIAAQRGVVELQRPTSGAFD
jgi:hypothetical protein